MTDKISKLENQLLSDSWINSGQYGQAKEEQEKSGKSLYSIIVRKGYMSEEDVYIFFAQCSNIPFVRISDYKIEESLVNLFSENFYRENLILPLFKIENTLYIAMVNPLDSDLLNTLTMQTKAEISSLFTTPSSILEAINSNFGPDDKYFALEELIFSPQSLHMIPPIRESERLNISLPVEFKPESGISLISSAFISGVTADISSSGKALGIRTFVFLPSGIQVFVKFPQNDPAYSARAEVVRCSMEKGGRYFLGVKFLDIKDDLVKSILAQAKAV